MRPRELALGLLLAAAAACAPGPQPAGPASAGGEAALTAAVQSAEAEALGRLPQGRGRVTVLSSCLMCHGAGIIVQQRKDAAAWTRTIRQMVTWGAPLPSGEEEALAAYLAQHFGPAAARE